MPKSVKTADELWRCPNCGAGLVTRNMSHSCGVFTLDEYFGGNQKARRLFDDYLRLARQVGPFELIPQKTRITFLAQTRFAGVQRFGKDFLIVSFGFPRQIRDPRIEKVDHFLTWYVHYVRMTDKKQFDEQLLDWLKESYHQMGLRKHLNRR